jgi:hypothetical protein
MKKIYILISFLIGFGSFGQDLLITGVFDGPLSGGTPKVIEVYAINDVSDLSLYGVGSANNGGGTDGEELTFAGSATAGQFIYITTDDAQFNAYFGFSADYVDGFAGINGDDAIELFFNGNVVDTFGDINVDGSGQSWEYADGWAYRLDSTGPDGSTFVENNWTFSGPDAVDGCTDNTTCASVFPLGSFSFSGSPCGVTFDNATYNCATNNIGDNNDAVTINIPYFGSNGTIVNVSTSSNGTIGGDDPALTADGTITITGLSEGDNWDITLNGGDCDGTTFSGTVPAAECDPVPNTCFDLSTGSELLELVAVTPNSGFSNNGIWEENNGTYSANGFCGGGCEELVETWLIFGPLDMNTVSDLELSFDASENFGTTDLVVAYTDNYSNCPSSTTWTTAQTITDAGSVEVDLSMASGSDVFIGIQYLDDGVDGYSDWELSNVSLDAFGACPTLGTRPTSNCAVCDITLGEESFNCSTNTAGDNNDTVIVEIPYTGLESSITSITSTSATVAGDNPASIADGVIFLTGLMEGDAWDLTINGGDCDGTTVSGTIPSAACDPTTNDLVINEIHADPAPDLAGDANGDGTRDGSEDEFVEFYNVGSSDLDLSGFTVEDGFGLRHTFPAGTIVPSNSFITVFGGGTPTGITGLVQVASEGGLGLNNGGDDVIVKNAAGNLVVSVTYAGASDQSVGRSPDFTGDFADHSTIAGNNGALFSPNQENDDPSLSTDTFNIEAIDMYPNPVKNGFVTISVQNSSGFSIELYNILGKKVLSQNAETSTQINVSALQSGIYLVKISENNNSLTKKLIVQ